MACTDLDWALDHEQRRSQSGYFLKLAGGAISWTSRAQRTIALSSTEAEYMALSDCSCLSRSDPWQTKFSLLCQDIRNIKANKYVSIRRTNNNYNRVASSAPNKDKHPPMDKRVRGGQDGIYYEDNRTEHPLLNTLDTPTHYDSTRYDASQVPL